MRDAYHLALKCHMLASWLICNFVTTPKVVSGVNAQERACKINFGRDDHANINRTSVPPGCS